MRNKRSNTIAERIQAAQQAGKMFEGGRSNSPWYREELKEPVPTSPWRDMARPFFRMVGYLVFAVVLFGGMAFGIILLIQQVK